jgi:hypothetical protein
MLKAHHRVQVRPFPAPRWQGEALSGKSILIHAEQGVGDEIWAAGMIDDVIARAQRVVVETTAKLVPLFARSFPHAEIVPKTNPPDARCFEGIDYQVPQGSLGRYLRGDLKEFPAGRAYLKADGLREAYWKAELAKLGPGLKVGVSWRGANAKGERALSYSRLTQWGELFGIAGIEWVNLQYDECEAELQEAEAKFGVKIHRYPEVDMFDDLDETAALMRGLDLVISAPTTVSILSAALGVNTWQMFYGVHWQHFGLERSPWYAKLITYSRSWQESWDEVLGRIADDLRAVVAGQREIVK